MLINYSLLSTLLTLAPDTTFAEAAKKLRVTPSAVSHQVRTLETELGVRLFERVGRRARLTPEAKALREVLRAHLPPIDHALETLRDDHRVVRGVVRVAGPLPFAREWLRQRVATLLREHPELELRVSFGVPTLLVPKLEAGELDFVIAGELSESRLLDAERIDLEEFWAVCSRAYLSGRRRPLTPSDFAEETFILFDDNRPMHANWWRAMFGKRAPETARARLSVANLDEMLHYAESGLGIAVLPSYLVRDSLAAGKLQRVDPDKARCPRNSLYLLTRKNRVQSARHERVHAALVQRK